MALIKCPQCGGNISDKAVKCPHCGCTLGKATIIQQGNGVDAKAMSTAGKIILAVAIVVGSAMCIIPLFTNLYERGETPAFGYYLPITYVLMGFGIIAGVLSFGLAVYGIIRLCRNKVSTWKYWLLSTVFAWVSVFAVFGLIVYNAEAFEDLWYNSNRNKIGAAKGTYECQLQDGTTISFSIGNGGDGFFACKSSDGTTRIGHCHVYYEIRCDEYCFDEWLPESSYDGANMSKSNHYFYMNGSDNLKYMYVDGVKYPLKKISDGAKTETQAKQEKQAKDAEEAVNAWKTESKKWVGRFTNYHLALDASDNDCPVSVTLKSTNVNTLEGTYEVDEELSFGANCEVESKKWTIKGYIEDGKYFHFTATNGKHKTFDITNTEGCRADYEYHYHYSKCSDFEGVITLENNGTLNFEGMGFSSAYTTNLKRW